MDVTYHDVSPRRTATPKLQRPGAAGGAASRKTVATACVIGWSAFWVFGFLALSEDFALGEARTAVELIMAAAGFAVGMWAYLRLCRDTPSLNQEKTPAHPQVDLPDDL